MLSVSCAMLLAGDGRFQTHVGSRWSDVSAIEAFVVVSGFVYDFMMQKMRYSVHSDVHLRGRNTRPSAESSEIVCYCEKHCSGFSVY